MQIFDTHCHFNDDELYTHIDELINNAKNNGVSKFLVVGYNKKTSLLAVEIAQKYDFCYATIGFHPSEVYDLSEEEYQSVVSLINRPKVVAVGEIGLDYYWCKDEELRKKQKYWFDRQITFANEHHKPIVIHNRDAFLDCLSILKENKPLFSGTMHCYGGSVESLNDVLNLGLFIGLDGPVTYKNAVTPKLVAEAVPLDRLLIETDSPYLSPVPKRGQVNEPANIVYIIDTIANIKKIAAETLANATFLNACKLFGIK